jgi:proteic killer suppression protein
MIQSFRHKGLQRLFVDGERRGINPDMVEKIENILAVLSRARVPSDLGLPGFRLHPLRGRLKGFWSVTMRANWRIIFRFQNGHVTDVDKLL